MQTQRTVDGAPTPPSPESTLVTAPVVPQRSVRRATARRASNRRATARRRKDDIEGRMIEYLNDHPQSKRQPRHGRRRAVTPGSGARDHVGLRGQIAMAHILSQRVTSAASGPDQEVGPTITAVLDDGPLRGVRVEAEVVEGRPPSTVNVPADDGSTCRYCLADWVQSGPSAVYTFLYRV
jgi:hypothetical protein